MYTEIEFARHKEIIKFPLVEVLIHDWLQLQKSMLDSARANCTWDLSSLLREIGIFSRDLNSGMMKPK